MVWTEVLCSVRRHGTDVHSSAWEREGNGPVVTSTYYGYDKPLSRVSTKAVYKEFTYNSGPMPTSRGQTTAYNL
ncbi:hypothetical protein C2845_PM18G03980 [Panicum miliaceum]|uniref:Uncharacterized protein n=1 Tax=Panicum miliaceum TaxID=4540 RepID=A0A3L6PGY3_PANMI|nr:hypothetical protein C2845_PM18G03980 [Panicum miliaceum]